MGIQLLMHADILKHLMAFGEDHVRTLFNDELDENWLMMFSVNVCSCVWYGKQKVLSIENCFDIKVTGTKIYEPQW